MTDVNYSNYIPSFNQNNFHKKLNKLFDGLPKSSEYRIEYGSSESELIADKWKIHTSEKGLMPGYFSSLNECEVGIALLKDKEVVMSLTPLERESHFVAQYSANGHVVIAGLGLSMITLSVLEKKSVRRVTVLEVDDQLIDLYPAILKGSSKKLWEDSIKSRRLSVIKADCKQPLATELINTLGKVDYLWVDIWNNLGNTEARSITKSLSDQLKPSKCDFWGVEIELAHTSILNRCYLDVRGMRAIASEWGIPLSIDTMPSKQAKMYCELCYLAAKNMLLQEKRAMKKNDRVFGQISANNDNNRGV